LDKLKKIRNINTLYFIIIGLITFTPLIHVGLVINDDLLNSINVHNNTFVNYLHQSINAWKVQGRPNIFASIFYYLPFAFDNFAYYKFVSLGTIILNIILFSIMIRQIFGSKIFFNLGLLVSLVFIQNSWEHNPITAFPGFFSIPLSLLFLSIILFTNYLDNNKTYVIICSALLYAISLFSYELFILYSPIFLVIALMKKKNFKDTLLNMLPYLICIIIYLLLYFLIRMIYGSHYEGVKINDSFNLFNVLKVIWQFSISSFPLYFMLNKKYQFLLFVYNDSYKNLDFKTVLSNIKLLWVIKGILVVTLFLKVIEKYNYRLNKKIYFGLLIGLVYIFVPSVLLSLTPLYQTAVIKNNQLGMPASYFSFYSVVLIACIIIVILIGKTKGKWKGLIISIISVLMFIISIGVDYSNNYITYYQVKSNFKWIAIDNLIARGFFDQLPVNSVVYAPSLWYQIGSVGIHDSYWSDYISTKIKKKINVVKKLEVTKGDVYYLRFSQQLKDNNQFIVFSKISNVNSMTADKVYIEMLSKYDEYNIIGNTNENYINNNGNKILLNSPNFFNIKVNYNYHLNGDFKETVLEGKDIQLDSLNIIYGTNN
jgi:hypothetical protein